MRNWRIRVLGKINKLCEGPIAPHTLIAKNILNCWSTSQVSKNRTTFDEASENGLYVFGAMLIGTRFEANPDKEANSQLSNSATYVGRFFLAMRRNIFAISHIKLQGKRVIYVLVIRSYSSVIYKRGRCEMC